LRDAGRAELAHEIARAAALAADDAVAPTFLTELIRRCDARALGDVNVPGLEWREWLALVDELRAACERELARRTGKPASS
jgi:hypothetical protein